MEVLATAAARIFLPPLLLRPALRPALVVKNHCLTTRAAAKADGYANHLYDGLQKLGYELSSHIAR